MGSVAIDVLDRRIIQALYVDPRAPFSRLAEVLGSSEQTVSRRYRRLFDDRILRVVGQLDSQRFGQYDWAVRIRCAPGSAPTVATKLAQHPDTSWVQLTSGGTEIFSKIHSRDGEQRTPLLLSQLSVGRQVVDFEAYCLLHLFATGLSAPPRPERPQPWRDRPTPLFGTGQAVDRSPEGQAAGLRLAARPSPRRRRPRSLSAIGSAHALARDDRPTASRGTHCLRRPLLRLGPRQRRLWDPLSGPVVDVGGPRKSERRRTGLGQPPRFSLCRRHQRIHQSARGAGLPRRPLAL